MISQISRHDASLVEDGENEHLYVKPDLTSVLIVTSRGVLHYYDIMASNKSYFELQYKNVQNHQTAEELYDLPKFLLRFRNLNDLTVAVSW